MKIKPSDVITLDIETFWDVDYTLTKLSTSEYVLSNLFKAHCVGVKHGNKPTKVYSDELKIQVALRSIDWPSKYLLCHNTHFDGFILTQRYGIKPKGYLDTLSMARCAIPWLRSHNLDSVSKFLGFAGKLDAGVSLVNTKGKFELSPAEMKSLSAYCAVDVDLTYSIFKQLLECYPETELDLINLTVRMFCEPTLEIDVERVVGVVEKEIGEKAALLQQANVSRDDLLSNEKFIALVAAYGVKPGYKISKTTGQPALATAKTDQWMQDLLKDKNPHVRTLAQARIRIKSTINETRAARFLTAGERSKLPFGIAYWAAHTGRWGGMNKMNLQNLERKGELRKAILPPPGYVIGKGDSSQVEARVTAWLADQSDLLEQFRNLSPDSPVDVYTSFASQIYQTLITKKNELERYVGKTSVLGLGFGMGPEKFQDTLAKGKPPVNLDLNTCQRIVMLYRKINYMIVKLWKLMEKIIIDMAVGREGSYKCISWGKEHIRLPNGCFLKYPGLTFDSGRSYYRSNRGEMIDIYGGKLLENIVQALARIAVAEQMLEIDKKYRVVGMEHDAVAILIKEREAERAMKHMLACMKKAPIWALDLPISAETKFAAYYL